MRAAPSAPGGTSAVLLGAPFIEHHGTTREFLPERRFELLAHLAYRGEWTSRDALAGMFWPDQDNAGARRNLRWVLHSLRDFPGFACIEAERHRIRLQLPTDVRRFDDAIRGEDWPEALRLYRGELCVGLDAHASEPFAQWLRLERGRLAGAFRRAALARIESSGATEVCDLARRLLTEDPADEDAVRAAMRALRAHGQEREAKRLYSEFALRLMDDLGLEPSAGTRTLAQALDVPTLAAPTAPPIESTFVGRQREQEEIAALLAHSECRLLTLIGPGGVGKSRLARKFRSQYGAAPAWLVPLDALTVPSQVAGEVARAIGIRLTPRASAEAQVQAAIGNRRCLLILDNFEHLIDAAVHLERWLAACAQLQILVTSRERLDVDGEWLLPVEGLAVPENAEADSRSFDSVRLFAERARAAKGGFDAVAEQDGIVAIVTHVGGMPLAIELAAAWVRLLPCADIAQDLAENLELLQSESFGRLRSVRASFDHSWSLLMARERSLFANLGVFRGGFDREAARHVAEGTIPSIAQLVDKLLVRADGTGRFSLHPLLLQYAIEKLDAAPDVAASAQRRHAEYYAHWMARFAGAGQVNLAVTMPALEREIGNCLAAWDWAVLNQRADIVRSTSIVLLAHFEHRGRVSEGLELFASADRLLPAAAEYGAAMGNVERARATLSLRAGQYDDAERHARLALQQFRRARDATGIKSSLTTMGLANWQRARYATARPYFAEGLKRCRADGDRSGEAGFLTNLALLAKADGRYDEARDLLTQAIEIYRAIANPIHLTSALNNLGNLYRSLHQPERGRAPLLEALAIGEENGDAITLPFVVINLALIELELEELDAAQRYAERALAIVRKGADRQIEIGCHATLARIALARGAAAQAREHNRAAATMARELKHLPLLLGAAVNAAAVLRLDGRPEISAAILYMVESHPSAGQPDRDDVARELKALAPVLTDDMLDAARSQAARLTLDDVISQAIGTAAFA